MTVISVCFSPDGNCGATVAYWISRANSTIHIEIYDFTLNQISDALVNAYQANPKLNIEIVWNNGTANERGESVQATLVGSRYLDSPRHTIGTNARQSGHNRRPHRTNRIVQLVKRQPTRKIEKT